MIFLPRFEDDVTDWRGIKELLILKIGRKVDAVILADVADCVRWKFLCFRRDTENLEDFPSSGQITAKGPWTDVCQSCQRAFADKSFLVVVIDHFDKLIIENLKIDNLKLKAFLRFKNKVEDIDAPVLLVGSGMVFQGRVDRDVDVVMTARDVGQILEEEKGG